MVRHEDEHLRRFLSARARCDEEEMRRWWEELLIDFFDRIQTIVSVTHRGQLNAEEHELAVHLSLCRFSANLIWTFRGHSMGQLVNATRTLVRGICMDVQRNSMRERRHMVRSLDAGWNPDAMDRPTDAWELEEATRRFEREGRVADAQEFLAWALPQLVESRRRVLELTFEGARVSEIMDEVGISEGNTYQLRSRGMSDLRALRKRYDA